MPNKRISILGTVGVPANYGGFETLAENLTRYHNTLNSDIDLTVYCSGKSYPNRLPYFLSARLKYISLKANGVQSIFYDIISMFSAVWNRSDVILLLGVSGAVILPLVRFLSKARIITNIDGIEWRREKWRGLARLFLKYSEKLAVNYSDEVIADNQAIKEYIQKEYNINCHVIAYGGDHAINSKKENIDMYQLPGNYSFLVCRIEPENNIHMILEAFFLLPGEPLVIVGNWKDSKYGIALREKYKDRPNITLLDPIYNLGQLASLRTNSKYLLHGHSAGGTNPSLVEAMHFSKPIIAFDCSFNRYTTDNKAIYFDSAKKLISRIDAVKEEEILRVSKDMKDIAEKRYTWDIVAGQYFALINPASGA